MPYSKDQASKLWNTLVKDEYDTADIGKNADEFSEKLQDADFSGKLYKTLIEDDYDPADIGQDANAFMDTYAKSLNDTPPEPEALDKNPNRIPVIGSPDKHLTLDKDGNVVKMPGYEDEEITTPSAEASGTVHTSYPQVGYPTGKKLSPDEVKAQQIAAKERRADTYPNKNVLSDEEYDKALQNKINTGEYFPKTDAKTPGTVADVLDPNKNAATAFGMGAVAEVRSADLRNQAEEERRNKPFYTTKEFLDWQSKPENRNKTQQDYESYLQYVINDPLRLTRGEKEDIAVQDFIKNTTVADEVGKAVQEAVAVRNATMNDVAKEHLTDDPRDITNLSSQVKGIASANKKLSSEEIIKRVEDRLNLRTLTSAFLDKINKQSEELGISPTEYADMLKPKLQEAIAAQVRDGLANVLGPQNNLDYIVNGISNSVVGMIADKMIYSPEQIELKNKGILDYGNTLAKNAEGSFLKQAERVLTEGARVATGFAADGWIMAGGSFLGTKAISQIGKTFIDKAIARGIPEAEARALMAQAIENTPWNERLKMKLAQSMLGGAINLGTYTAASETGRQFQSGQWDLGQILEEAAKGAGEGAVLGIGSTVAHEIGRGIKSVAGSSVMKYASPNHEYDWNHRIQVAGNVIMPAAAFGVETGLFTTMTEAEKYYSGEGDKIKLRKDLFDQAIQLLSMKLTGKMQGAIASGKGAELFNPKAVYQNIKKAITGDGPLRFTKQELSELTDNTDWQSLTNALIDRSASNAAFAPGHISRDVEVLATRGTGTAARALTPDERKLAIRNATISLFNDDSLSWSTKAKVSMILGLGMPATKPQAVGYKTTIDDQTGRCTAYTTDENGKTIDRIDFDNEEQLHTWEDEKRAYFESQNPDTNASGTEPIAGETPATETPEQQGDASLNTTEKPVDTEPIDFRTRAQQNRQKGAEMLQSTNTAEVYDWMMQHRVALNRRNNSFKDGSQNAALKNQIQNLAESGMPEEAYQKLDTYKGNFSDLQYKALADYIDTFTQQLAYEEGYRREIGDAIAKREAELQQMKSETGVIQPVYLFNGENDPIEAYLINGDMNNGLGTVRVFVPSTGQTVQIPSRRIIKDKTPAPTPITAVMAQERARIISEIENRRLNMLNGTTFEQGDRIKLAMEGAISDFEVLGRDQNGNIIVESREEGEEPVQFALTPQEAIQMRKEAENISIQNIISADNKERIEQQRAEAEAERQRIEAEKQARYGQGIAGYTEGHPDYAHENSDTQTVGEYLRELVPETAKRDETIRKKQEDLQKQIDQAEAQRAESQRNLDAFGGDDTRNDALWHEIIMEANAKIEDYQKRIEKWNDIREAALTPEEKADEKNQRQKEVNEAQLTAEGALTREPLTAQEVETMRKKLSNDNENDEASNASIIKTGTKKEANDWLLQNFQTMLEADEYLNEERRKLISEINNAIDPELSAREWALKNHVDGTQKLTPEEIKKASDDIALLKAVKKAVVDEAAVINDLRKGLEATYKERNDEELAAMEPADQRATRLAQASNGTYDKKLQTAKEIYGDLIDENSMVPQDAEEYVAANLPKGQLNWEGLERGTHHVRGMQEAVGRDKKRGIGRGYDTNAYNAYLAPKGQGIGIDEMAHQLWENQEGEQRYDDTEIADAIISVLTGASKPNDIRDYILDRRIDTAEDMLKAEEEAEKDAMEISGLNEKQLDLIDKVSKDLGMKVVFEEPTGSAENGWIDKDTRTIHIVKGTGTETEFVLGHELTHQLKADSPRAYKEFEAMVHDIVKDIEGERNWEAWINKRLAQYQDHYYNRAYKKAIDEGKTADEAKELAQQAADAIDRETILEEGAADFAGQMHKRPEMADKMLGQIAETMKPEAVKSLSAKMRNAITRAKHALRTADMSKRDIVKAKNEEQSLDNLAKKWRLAYNISHQLAKRAEAIHTNAGAEAATSMSLRETPYEGETRDAYKLMRLDDDGEVRTLFIDQRGAGWPMGKWQNADAPKIDKLLEAAPHFAYLVDGEGNILDKKPIKKNKSGKFSGLPNKKQVDAAARSENGQRWMVVDLYADGRTQIANVGFATSHKEKDGRKVDTFALRPGIHAGNLPSMEQIGSGTLKSFRDDNLVWVKGKVAYGNGAPEEALANGGEITTHIPVDGGYLKGTNPTTNKEMQWYISGAFLPEKIISDKEARDAVDAYNKENDTHIPYDYARQGGKQFYADTMQLEDPRPGDEMAEAPVSKKGQAILREQGQNVNALPIDRLYSLEEDEYKKRRTRRSMMAPELMNERRMDDLLDEMTAKEDEIMKLEDEMNALNEKDNEIEGKLIYYENQPEFAPDHDVITSLEDQLKDIRSSADEKENQIEQAESELKDLEAEYDGLRQMKKDGYGLTKEIGAAYKRNLDEDALDITARMTELANMGGQETEEYRNLRTVMENITEEYEVLRRLLDENEDEAGQSPTSTEQTEEPEKRTTYTDERDYADEMRQKPGMKRATLLVKGKDGKYRLYGEDVIKQKGSKVWDRHTDEDTPYLEISKGGLDAAFAEMSKSGQKTALIEMPEDWEPKKKEQNTVPNENEATKQKPLLKIAYIAKKAEKPQNFFKKHVEAESEKDAYNRRRLERGQIVPEMIDEKRMSDIQKNIYDTEDRITEKQDRIDELEEEIADVLRRQAEFEEYGPLDSEQQALIEETDELQMKLDDLNKQLADLQDKKRTYTSTPEDIEEYRKELAKDILDINKRMSELSMDDMQASDEYQRLRDVMEELTDENDLLDSLRSYDNDTLRYDNDNKEQKTQPSVAKQTPKRKKRSKKQTFTEGDLFTAQDFEDAEQLNILKEENLEEWQKLKAKLTPKQWEWYVKTLKAGYDEAHRLRFDEYGKNGQVEDESALNANGSYSVKPENFEDLNDEQKSDIFNDLNNPNGIRWEWMEKMHQMTFETKGSTDPATAYGKLDDMDYLDEWIDSKLKEPGITETDKTFLNEKKNAVEYARKFYQRVVDTNGKTESDPDVMFSLKEEKSYTPEEKTLVDGWKQQLADARKQDDEEFPIYLQNVRDAEANGTSTTDENGQTLPEYREPRHYWDTINELKPVLKAAGFKFSSKGIMKAKKDKVKFMLPENTPEERTDLPLEEQGYSDEEKENVRKFNNTYRYNTHLADKVFNVIPLVKHELNTNIGDSALKKAIVAYARKEGVLKTYSNKETAGKGIVNVSAQKMGKLLDAAPKRTNPLFDVYLSLIRNIPELLHDSEVAEEFKSVNKDPHSNWRHPKFGLNEFQDIRVLYGAIEYDGTPYRVRTILQGDSRNGNKSNYYSYKIENIELLSSETPSRSGEGSSRPLPINSISGANLLNEVDKSYHPNEKIVPDEEKLTSVKQKDIKLSLPEEASKDEKGKTILFQIPENEEPEVNPEAHIGGEGSGTNVEPGDSMETVIEKGERKKEMRNQQRDKSRKPRRMKNESQAHYMARLRDWKRAEEKLANATPMPNDEDFMNEAHSQFATAMEEWRQRHGLTGEQETGAEALRRKEGESDEDYLARLKANEAWEAAMKDTEDPMPNVMDFEYQAQQRYKKAYEEWKIANELTDEANMDLLLYDGKGGNETDEPVGLEQGLENQKIQQEMAENVGYDTTPEGAQRHMKNAVIERRKQLESSSAEDALFIMALGDKIAKANDDVNGNDDKGKKHDLNKELPGLIELPSYAAQRITSAYNEANHGYYESDSIQNLLPYILGGEDTSKLDTNEQKVVNYFKTFLDKQAEALEKFENEHPEAKQTGDTLADWEAYINGEGTYNETSTKTSNKEPGASIFIDPRPLREKWALRQTPVVKGLMSEIKDWYDQFYQYIEDAGLRRDAGYVADYVNHVWDKEKSTKEAWDNYQRMSSPNMQHREIFTYQEGIDMGLAPKYENITDMMSHYSRQNNEALANRAMLDYVANISISETNKDGEVVRILPLVSDTTPRIFDKDMYERYDVPGVGDVWVLKAAKKYFASVFGTERTKDVPGWVTELGHRYDVGSSTMKKIQLGLSFFHALALSEVALAQMNPVAGMQALLKYVCYDALKQGTLPAYAHPEDFKLAAGHLVSLGATQDYCASDVNAMTAQLKEVCQDLYEKSKAAGSVPLALSTMMDWMNRGIDTVLWNYIHDGLKIACFKMYANDIYSKAKKNGWDETKVDQMLDEAGQLTNDTFGGQYWEILGVSPATIKWLRRCFLSPDWLVSTQRHFFSMTGFGSLYSEEGFLDYLKHTGQRVFGKSEIDNDGRKFRSKESRFCYLVGVLLMYYPLMNALNAVFRRKDEKEEQKKADEIRANGNPDYQSPYELKYPDGMKWYDYTMLGNTVGQQTHLFTGRYDDGTETYVRWGKQFREFPEMFIGRHGVEFPTPLLDRMKGKGNPVFNFLTDAVGYLGVNGFQTTYSQKELQEKYGKEIGFLAMTAQHFLPFSIPTQDDKEFKYMDLFMPSAKGFTKYKALDYFKTYVTAGDMNGVLKTYDACVMNGIDPKETLEAAIKSVKATQKKELALGIKDLSQACKAFDGTGIPENKKKFKNEIVKYLGDQEYTTFTRMQTQQTMEDYLNPVQDEMGTTEKELMLQTSQDVVYEYKVSRLKKLIKVQTDRYKRLQKQHPDEAAQFRTSHQEYFNAEQQLKDMQTRVNALKKTLGNGNDEQTMKNITAARKSTLESIGKLK